MALLLSSRDKYSVSCREPFGRTIESYLQLAFQDISDVSFQTPVALHKFVCEFNETQSLIAPNHRFEANARSRCFPGKGSKVHFHLTHTQTIVDGYPLTALLRLFI